MSLEINERVQSSGLFFMSLEINERVQSGGLFFNES